MKTLIRISIVYVFISVLYSQICITYVLDLMYIEDVGIRVNMVL